MKSFIFLVFLLGLFQAASGQVGIGTTTPASSAELDVSSTTRGFLPPRLTTEQIKGITSPEEGLMVYNLTLKQPCFFNGIRWSYYDTTYVLPELGKYWSEAGGIVIFLDSTGLHGIAAATQDQSATAVFGCSGLTIMGAFSGAIGVGQANTNAIIAACGTPLIAARLCNNLELNGKSDWYLPSLDELHLMYFQIQAFPTLSGTHISSTQNDANSAWMESFPGGIQLLIPKDAMRAVRAVRSF